MPEWDGHERRSIDMDWLQHKENILNQLKELKTSTKETDDKVTSMKVDLAVLNTKLMVASGISSFVVATVISIIGFFIGK